MTGFFELVGAWHKHSWAWFTRHAQSRHALWWLALVAFTDALFFPVAPEVFLVALIIAHPDRLNRYLPVAIIATTLGALAGYGVAAVLFQQFGEPILQWYGLGGAFEHARHFIEGHVFWAMMVASFTPIPDKVFIYAGGFLGAPLAPFIAGYVLGRGARMALVCYLARHLGPRILDILGRYLKIAGLILLAAVVYYGIVHFHLFGL